MILFILLDITANVIEFMVYEFLLRKMMTTLKSLQVNEKNWLPSANKLLQYKKIFLLIYFPWTALITTVLMLTSISLANVNYDLANTIRVTLGGVAYALFTFTPSFFIIDGLIDRWYGRTLFHLFETTDLKEHGANLISLSIRERFFIPMMVGSASLVTMVVMSLVQAVTLEQIMLIISFIVFFWITGYLYHRSTLPTIQSIITQTSSLLQGGQLADETVTTDSLDEIGELLLLNNHLIRKIRFSSQETFNVASELTTLVEQYSESFESLQHITEEINKAIATLSKATIEIAESVNEVAASFSQLEKQMERYRGEVSTFSRGLRDLMMTLRILSLNAHIEASRVGITSSTENPKAFVVIAETVHEITQQVVELNKKLHSSLETFQKSIFDHATENIDRLENSSQIISDFSSRFEETAASVEEETAIIGRLKDDLDILLNAAEKLRKELALLHVTRE